MKMPKKRIIVIFESGSVLDFGKSSFWVPSISFYTATDLSSLGSIRKSILHFHDFYTLTVYIKMMYSYVLIL